MVIQKPVPLKKQVYNYIVSAILERELDEKEIYSEQWFAEKLNVSRTPVREALLQLREEGVIRVLPNRGVVFTPLTLQDAKELYQFRTAIEGYAAIYLATHCQDDRAKECIKQLEDLVNTQLIDGKYIHDNDKQFHRKIIEFTDNKEFLTYFDKMQTKIRLSWLDMVRSAERARDSVAEHVRILESIRNGDTCGAFSAVNEHFKTAYKVITANRAEAEIE